MWGHGKKSRRKESRGCLWNPRPKLPTPPWNRQAAIKSYQMPENGNLALFWNLGVVKRNLRPRQLTQGREPRAQREHLATGIQAGDQIWVTCVNNKKTTQFHKLSFKYLCSYFSPRAICTPSPSMSLETKLIQCGLAETGNPTLQRIFFLDSGPLSLVVICSGAQRIVKIIIILISFITLSVFKAFHFYSYNF